MKFLDKAIMLCDSKNFMANQAIEALYKVCQKIQREYGKAGGEIGSSQKNELSKAYDDVLDYHMDNYISKTEMRQVNNKCVEILKKELDEKQIRYLGFY